MRGCYGSLTTACDLHFGVVNDRFPDDKLTYSDSEHVITLDGVLLNKDALLKRYDAKDTPSLLVAMYRAHGAALARQLKGSYTLVLHEKKSGETLVTNDWLSKRPLYYATEAGRTLYAARYRTLLALLEQASWRATLDADAFRMMTANGYLGGDATYVREARFLAPFESLLVGADGSARVVRTEPEKQALPQEESALLERFHALFSQAVAAQYARNVAGGYEQVASLSAGMDSRSCLLMARALGYDDVACFTYAQSGSLDQSVPQQIARDLHLDLLFYPLDGGRFLQRLSENAELNECQQSGVGSTGARTIARLLDPRRMGIVHTGLFGGELLGDFITQGAGVPSTLGHIKSIISAPRAERLVLDEKRLIDNVRACQNFSSMFAPNCETASPFLDEDVFAFARAIPPERLYRRRFYRAWMERYLPNPYPTTYFLGPVDTPPLRELAAKLRRGAAQKLRGASRDDMNPIELWFASNPALGKSIEAEYETGVREARHNAPGDVLAIIEGAWKGGWEQRLYALSCLRALSDARAACAESR